MRGVDLSTLLDAVLPSAPPELFAEAAIEALRRAPPRLLDVPALGFECRLSAWAPPKIDLGLLTRPETALPPSVDAVFFEWDLLPAGELRAAPLRFFRFGSGLPLRDALDVIAALGPVPGAEALAALPPATRVTDLGWLDARVAGWTRVGVIVSCGEAIRLARMGDWGSAGAQMITLLAELASTHRELRVQLDLAPLRFVGIELIADQSPVGGGWEAMCEPLERSGISEPERVAAMRRWPGNAPLQLAGAWFVLRRTIGHIKVSRDSTGRLSSKAYLFAQLRDLW